MPNVQGQERNFVQSGFLDLPETGWNKVLCMHNGYTMLFHFEPTKNIFVKVFDSMHREVSQSKDAYSALSAFNMQNVIFKGAFDVNGEAVLFLEQEKMGTNTLIRARYQGNTGKLISDDIISSAGGHMRDVYWFVLKEKSEPGYAIVKGEDVPRMKHSSATVSYYDSDHKLEKEIPLDIDQDKYNYTHMLGADIQQNGVVVTVGLDKEIDFGVLTNTSPNHIGATIYDHILCTYFIPKGAAKANKLAVDLTKDNYPAWSFYTWNKFAGVLNNLVFCNKPMVSRLGLAFNYISVRKNMLFRISETDFSFGENDILNRAAAEDQFGEGSTYYFPGVPVSVTTDDNGLSTVCEENYMDMGEVEHNKKAVFGDYFGNICVTRFEDDGKELWGTILPLAQYHKSYNHYYPPVQMSRRNSHLPVFSDLPAVVYDRQFTLTNQYAYKGNYYILFNDNNENQNSSIKNPGDTVYNFNTTNMFRYKITGKNVVSRDFLLGPPTDGSYRAGFMEGADFDESSGIYASLVQYRVKGYNHIVMVWTPIDR
jgi:hypothetical protein